MREMLETAIKALPSVFRVVFVMREMEDMPAKEVAQLLGIPASTVKTRLLRARRRLRQALARVASLPTYIAGTAARTCSPVARRLMADVDPALEQQLFHVPHV